LQFTAFVRVLEARFHSGQGSDLGFVVVGHLVWRGRPGRRPPQIRPAASLGPQAMPTSMLSKLQYLIRATAPESFQRLQALRSRFWSFVDVTPELRKGEQ